MQQSRLASLAEAWTGTVIGYISAVLAQIFIFPLYDIHVNLSQNFSMAVVFTVIGFVRNYAVRRLFNPAPWRKLKERLS